MFFLAVFFTLVKYEQNQTLIFWSNGIKKRVFECRNQIFFSFLILQSVMNIFWFLLQDNEIFYKTIKLDFLPSLVKSQKFMDTVEKLTIYVDKKNEFVNLTICYKRYL